MPQSILPIPWKLSLLLAAGPLLFLGGIVIVSVALGMRGTPPADIPDRASALAPHILLGVLLCLGGLLVTWLPVVRVAWRWPGARAASVELLTGGVAGLLVGVAYVRWLAPLHELLQRSFGDYVPPGSVLPTISNSLGVFFVANIVLAPFVEETLYRGIALPLLTERYGSRAAVPLVCVFFGLLHWAGGFWYIALTGLVAGGLFATLFIWGGGIYAPCAAHLALNVVEFAYASQLH